MRTTTTTTISCDEALGIDLERVARTLRQLQGRARGPTAARLDELAQEVLELASDLAPDVVVLA